MKVILFTEDSFAVGNSYIDALRKLDGYVNEEYYKERMKYPTEHVCSWNFEKQEVIPIGMTITDDENAKVTDCGCVETAGGCWTLTIPLTRDRPPSGNYRFSIMQDLKDKDFKEELENHLVATYDAEFDKFCDGQGACCMDRCEFYKIKTDSNGEPTCLRLWYEKYKKPELEKEKKDGSD